jgi:hypothetical protein
MAQDGTQSLRRSIHGGEGNMRTPQIPAMTGMTPCNSISSKCSWSRPMRAKNQASDFRKNVRIEASCHIWTGARDGVGYGTWRFAGKYQRAHRVAWQLANGNIPPGMFVCHHCDNPSCVNLEHLFLGTPKDNTRDMLNKNRHIAERGEEHHNVKLTAAQVTEIRAMPINETMQRQLAKQYRVSISAIKHIQYRLTWRYLNPTNGE